jgi:hypothetical protein
MGKFSPIGRMFTISKSFITLAAQTFEQHFPWTKCILNYCQNMGLVAFLWIFLQIYLVTSTISDAEPKSVPK